MIHANIRPPRPCLDECANTHWRTVLAHEGDVRRCEHGRIWLCPPDPFLYSPITAWKPLSRFWNPIAHHRAVRVLGGGQ